MADLKKYNVSFEYIESEVLCKDSRGAKSWQLGCGHEAKEGG